MERDDNAAEVAIGLLALAALAGVAAMQWSARRRPTVAPAGAPDSRPPPPRG